MSNIINVKNIEKAMIESINIGSIDNLIILESRKAFEWLMKNNKEGYFDVKVLTDYAIELMEKVEDNE